MAKVNAESKLKEYVTKKVSQIRVITSDASDGKAPTVLQSRQEAASFRRGDRAKA